jgi:CRISPR/Cas system endoribonuclease Cas6 (RAMP superfamily)
MPLVKQLVEAQNGTMEIISELGFGTKVVLGFGAN